MEAETHWVYERMKLYELLSLHPDWSLRQFARTLGHDLKWVRKWKQRIESAVSVTVSTFLSASRAPHHPPQKVTPEAKALIAQLRDELSEKFHRKAGAKTILYELKKLQYNLPFSLPTAPSTITRILREMGYIPPPRPRWREPLVLPAPMEEWELDFGEITLEDEQRLEFLMVVDRGTSRPVYLEGSDGYQAESALEAVARLFLLHGLPKRLRFDRDPRLWGAWTRDSYPSPFVRFLRVLGVEPVICPPQRPDKKPFVERAIYTLKYEWLLRFSPATLAEGLDALETFGRYYNSERPHQGRACQNRTPDEAFPTLPLLPQLPERVQPDAWLPAYHGRVYRRRVSSAGTIQIDRHVYAVGSAYAKQQVLVHLDAQEECFFVSLGEQVIKRLPLQGLYHGEMDFTSYLIAMKTEARTVEAHRQFWWERVGEIA